METTPEQSAEGLAIVRVLAAVLDRLACANAPIALTDPGQITKFHAMKAPGIGIQQYLERIHKYASCSNECFILALIYIDRLIQRNNFLLTELNVHRVVITAVLLAAKFFDDAYYNNAYYAKVGGVLVSEINGLEVDFLFRINFSLRVTSDEFNQYRSELLSQLATTPMVSMSLLADQQQQYLSEQQYSYHSSHLHPHPSPVPNSSQHAAAAALAIQQVLDQKNVLQQVLDPSNSIQHVLDQSNALQRVLDQNNVRFVNDLRSGICDELVGAVQQIATQITPSPPRNSMEANQHLMSSISHHPNPAATPDDIMAIANNNLILEYLNHALDSNCSNNNNNNSIGGFPIMTRTSSMPVTLGGGMPSYASKSMDTTNSTFTSVPQSCPLQSHNPFRSVPPNSFPLEEQYLRLMLEGGGQPQQLYHESSSQFPVPHYQQQQQQQYQQLLHNDSIIDTPSASDTYNNMIVLQNEARRLAFTQGPFLAAGGLSSFGL